MSKDKSYYDQFNNCDDIKNRYDYFTVLEAALIWCGIPNDQLEFEASQCQPKGDDNGLQRGTFIHPYVSCVEPRCLVLHQAFEDNFLKMGRDGGESGFKSLTDFAVGHIAHPRRTIKIADLKEYIKNYHNDDMPKSLFPELNVNQDRTLPPNLIHDVYGRTYDINQHKKNREDDYLTLAETLSFLNYNAYDYVKLRDIARRKLITPCFYFDGYVGSFIGDSDDRDYGFYTELVAGYFTYRSLAEEICSDDDYMRLPNDGVMIYSILEKKTAKFADSSDVFLFNDKPRGLEEAEEFKLTHIDAGEIRFSKRALNSYIASLANTSQDDTPAQNDSELLAKLENAQTDNDKLTARLNTAIDTYRQNKSEITELKAQLDKANADSAELKEQLSKANATLANMPADDKELAPNSQTKVACMLYAILKEHDYDLSPPMGKGLANDLIVTASQSHGTPVTKNFVADWLKRANQAKINCTKK
ncbi:coiled-coil domain-containing protein [Psychrobacter alimentarius]|uniref:coiled-coil domain-containing protein n=1 Tax=Psychrobacter TaxID=497 RepID=UPI00117B587C|nr:hypothetical protein [Psychrobacter sp. JB193]